VAYSKAARTNLPFHPFKKGLSFKEGGFQTGIPLSLLSFSVCCNIILTMNDNELEKLKKKIYRPGGESEFEGRLEGPETFDPEQEREKTPTEEWQKTERKRLSPQQKKQLKIISIIALAVFLMVAGFFLWRGLTSFDKDKVKLEIRAAERIISGDEIKYTIRYKNETKLPLDNLQLTFRYPENSIPSGGEDLIETFDLGNLAVGEERETELLARIIGLKGEKKEAWAELVYTPSNISSRFSNRAEFSTEILSVPLILDFDLPERLVDGQSFSFSLRYSNQADVSFKDLQIQLEYPGGFTFESSQPQPFNQDNTWSISNLMAGEQDKIFIRGIIFGTEGEDKLFKAKLGLSEGEQFIPYAETTGATQVSISPLSVSQSVEDSTNYIARTGETLNYQIKYKNTTDIAIGDVVITSQLESRALDLTELDLRPGSFDGESQTITWNASNLPELEYLGPHQEGIIRFSVEIKDNLPINSYADKNFRIINTVKIDSNKVPLSLERIDISGESQLITKIVSDLSLQAQAFYNDDLIPNSGPIPPKVGQKTTYTVKWRLVNKNNDLSDVKVEASLPPHVKWENRISPNNANLNYDSQTGQVVWSIGNLAAGTGVLSPVKQVAFQISITPGLANIGGLLELIGQSKVTGQDTFVDLELSDTSRSIDSGLPDDPTMRHSDGPVVE